MTAGTAAGLPADGPFVSTGSRPDPGRVQHLVDEAWQRFGGCSR